MQIMLRQAICLVIARNGPRNFVMIDMRSRALVLQQQLR